MLEEHDEITEQDVHFLKPQKIALADFKCGSDWILDIGGGGEGIIGMLMGKQVVAIDASRDELRDTKNEALNIVMDAHELKFMDNTFETATAFFTLMYVNSMDMDKKWEDMDTIFSGVSRVLKQGGEFLIWDVNLKPLRDIEKKVVAFQLVVTMPDGRKIETGYSTKLHEQDVEDYIEMAERHGFEVRERDISGDVFFIRLKKSI